MSVKAVGWCKAHLKTSEIPCSPSSGLISRLTSQRANWNVEAEGSASLEHCAWPQMHVIMSPIDLHADLRIFSKIYTSKHWKTEQLCPTSHLCSRSHTDTVSDHGLWSQKARWRSLEMKNTQHYSALCCFTLRIQWGVTNACSQKLVNMSMYTMYWQRQAQNIFSFQKAMLAQPSFLLSSECCDAFLFKGSLLSNSQRFQATGLREVVNLPSSIWLRFESLQMTTCATFSHRLTHKSGIHLQFIWN